MTPDDAADPDDDKPSPSDAAVETPGATDAGAAEKPAQKTTVTTVTTRPDWAESLIEWCGKAADRAVYLRSRPIARDETGRRYFVLGGAAGANMVFLPMAGKLEMVAKTNQQLRALMIEGTVAIQSGEKPQLIKEKLKGFLAPPMRELVDAKR